jgi:hypothetical protein
MITLIIGALLAGALYATWRSHTLATENVQLRAQVASLKRQLARHGRDR